MTVPSASAEPDPNTNSDLNPAWVATSQRPVVLGMTGASGAPYAVGLLRTLCRAGLEVHLTISPSGAQVLREEMGIAVALNRFDPIVFGDLDATRLHYHHHADFGAGIASGSFLTAGMVIAPCSMSTLASIAHGITTNLVTRAADVHLKERRKLIVVPRETPLSLVHLENMLKATQAGAVVLPAMPGWYHRPESFDDLIGFIVSRICDQLGLENRLMRRWGKPTHSADLTTSAAPSIRTSPPDLE